MNNLLINILTVFFVLVILTYSIINIILNKALYNHINNDYINLNEHNQRSVMYKSIKEKYDLYLLENSHAQVNITTFIEEICSNLTFKKRYVLDNIKSIKNSSSNCILLGVLGTFVGLSLMLLSINTSDIINSLPQTISSMQTAFITSICGIVSSIVLNAILSHNDCEQILTMFMLKCENLLTSDITHNKSKDLDNKIEDVKDTIKQISKSIESIEKFDDISKDLNKFNKDFINSIKTLENLLLGSSDSIRVFDQDIRKLDKQFNILNIKFSKLFDKYDVQEDINKEILLDIKLTSKNINESVENQYKMREFLRSLSANFALYERTAQDLLVKLVDYEKNLSNMQGNINKEQINLDQTVKHLASVIAISSQDIDEKLNMIFDYIEIYKEAVAMDYMKEDRYKPENQEEIYDIEESDSNYSKSSELLRTSDVSRKKRQNKFISIDSKKRNKLSKSSLNKLIGDGKDDK